MWTGVWATQLVKGDYTLSSGVTFTVKLHIHSDSNISTRTIEASCERVADAVTRPVLSSSWCSGGRFGLKGGLTAGVAFSTAGELYSA
jgi:hypothetical protein